jgi:MIP family channel proteins
METSFTRDDQRAVAAEFLGSMFFVMLGCGSVCAAFAFGANAGVLTGGALVGVALAHGFAYLVAVSWTGNLSGGHINPVVTLAMMATGKIAMPKGLAYIVAQVVGAVAGAVLIKLAIPDAVENASDLGVPALSSGATAAEGLVLEILLTAFLVLVVFTTSVSRKGWGVNAPIAIGLAVAVIYFVGVPFTGPAVNPARSFGPALVANQWDDFWIYILGPAIGALVTAGLWLFWKTYGEDLDPDTPRPAPHNADDTPV